MGTWSPAAPCLLSNMKIHSHLVDRISDCLRDTFVDNWLPDRAIEKYLRQNPKWGSRDRRFFAEGVYEVVRWKTLIEYLLASVRNDGQSSQSFQREWVVGYWLKHRSFPEVDFFSVQDKKVIEEKLKELQLKAEKNSDAHSLALLQGFPEWMYQWGLSERGVRWDSIAKSLNHASTVDLRVNELVTDRKTLIQSLQAEGIETNAIEHLPAGLVLKERRNVFTTKAYKNGMFEVQDRASQMVAPFLDPKPGERVIDACAGAGGKSLHIASLMKNKGKIISMDIHQRKLDELAVRAKRNKISIIETRLIDTTKVIKRLDQSADRVLLDVPCSGMGVLRRSPGSKWRLSREQVDELKLIQKDILSRYSQMTKKGGILAYATCSLMPSENQQQVQEFLKQDESFELIKEMQIDPDQGMGDGFYCALMKRKISSTIGSD